MGGSAPQHLHLTRPAGQLWVAWSAVLGPVQGQPLGAVAAQWRAQRQLMMACLVQPWLV